MSLAFDMIGNGYRCCRVHAKEISAIFIMLSDRSRRCCQSSCYCLGLFPNNRGFSFVKIALGNSRQFFTATRTSTEAWKNAVFKLKLSIIVLATCTHAGFHERLFKVIAVMGERGRRKLCKGRKRFIVKYIVASAIISTTPVNICNFLLLASSPLLTITFFIFTGKSH